jgi:hypothetical protein
MDAILEIGATITFTYPTGETRSARVEARNWSFLRFTGYVAVDDAGKRYHINPQLESGYAS